jgi:DnaK suppressor protein
MIMLSKFERLQIRQQLDEERQAIARRQELRDAMLIESAADEMDESQAAEARELAIRHLEHAVRTLRQIDKAIRKLDTGEYGICESCEKMIGAKRLHAVPWVRLCLNCQEIADQSECDDSGAYETEPVVSAA